jgi:hypothetical protein
MRNIEFANAPLKFAYRSATSEAQFVRLVWVLYAVECEYWRLTRQTIGTAKEANVTKRHIPKGTNLRRVSAKEAQRNIVIRLNISNVKLASCL